MNKKIILLIDDDEGFRESVKTTLEQYNYLVIEVDCGKNALKILKSTKFDLAIIDIIMPEMNGVELAKELDNLYPSIQKIGMTGGDNRIDRAFFHPPSAKFFNAFLSKPFRSIQLLNTVKKLIE